MKNRGNRLRIGLYGLAYHAVLAAVLLGAGAAKEAEIGREVAIAVPCLLVAAFTVYFFVVSSYVDRRTGLRGTVLYDSLVGMLAAFIIVALTSALYSLIASFDAFAGGGAGAYLQAFGMSVILHLLWAFASFMMHILIFGNLAGLIGWYVLKKTAPSGS